ncbi:MAG: hypothetical protein KVP17_001830 [Porospora cf. gigantea B]|uniref:uncharacterized protein n=2 Tax=Porospora cf. gigantea B TaxID=2853592 RepID=UPI003571DDDA|nr:MAG: hypothetical protein KVP17_001830 [Porospora cf. gigantea B]
MMTRFSLLLVTVAAGPSCVGKPGMEAYHAHCKKNVDDETGCKAFYQFCDWVQGEVIWPVKHMGMGEEDLFGNAHTWAHWRYADQSNIDTNLCDCLQDPDCPSKESRCGLKDKAVYTVWAVPDFACHMTSEIGGLRHDPADKPGGHMDLAMLFPDLAKANDLQPGDGGASWWWWCVTKKSWNEWGQSSFCAEGEREFASEEECRKMGEYYWDSVGFKVKFLTYCDRFASRAPGWTNEKCRTACESGYDADEFHLHCVWTDYFAENDHSWPNFKVSPNNSCFEQWQMGYEDQGCDMNIPADYDGSEWTYNNGSKAECGRFIMDGPGVPRNVNSAHECQQYCQDDPKCEWWQWRPSPDWKKAVGTDASGYNTGLDNRLNQVRSCALKTSTQWMGAYKATYSKTTGNWLHDPKLDDYRYANAVQNEDCYPHGDNWCYSCLDESGQAVGKAFKWRNVMLSGPKYCNVPPLGTRKDPLPQCCDGPCGQF